MYIITKCKHIIQFIILFVSVSAFCQTKGITQLKISDNFLRSVAFETNAGSVYLTNVKFPQLNTNYKLLLDNGCHETYISESLAKEVKFKPTGKSKIIDIYNNEEKLPVGRLDIIIGGVLFKNIETCMIADESFGSECDVKGIIGLNIIKKCIWSISLKKGIFISSDISSFDIEKYAKQKMQTKGSAIACIFSKGESVFALFDLGMNSFVELNPEYMAMPIGIKQIKNMIITDNAYFDGALLSYKNNINQKAVVNRPYAKIESFSLLGDGTVKDAIVEIDSSDYSALIIGSKILDYYDIILNIGKKEFYSKNITTEFKDFIGHGFGYEAYYLFATVTSIVEGEPAEREGLQLNDTIVEINNKPISKITDKVSKCRLQDAVYDELMKNDEVLIKINRLEKPILIKKEHLFD